MSRRMTLQKPFLSFSGISTKPCMSSIRDKRCLCNNALSKLVSSDISCNMWKNSRCTWLSLIRAHASQSTIVLSWSFVHSSTICMISSSASRWLPLFLFNSLDPTLPSDAREGRDARTSSWTCQSLGYTLMGTSRFHQECQHLIPSRLVRPHVRERLSEATRRSIAAEHICKFVVIGKQFVKEPLRCRCDCIKKRTN